MHGRAPHCAGLIVILFIESDISFSGQESRSEMSIPCLRHHSRGIHRPFSPFESHPTQSHGDSQQVGPCSHRLSHHAGQGQIRQVLRAIARRRHRRIAKDVDASADSLPHVSDSTASRLPGKPNPIRSSKAFAHVETRQEVDARIRFRGQTRSGGLPRGPGPPADLPLGPYRKELADGIRERLARE